MQFEFAFAASSAAAVAPHFVGCSRGLEAGVNATSMTVALPERTDMHSGNDDDNGHKRLGERRLSHVCLKQVRAAEPTGIAILSVVMKTGTHVAYSNGATKPAEADFVTDPKVGGDAAVKGSAARTQELSASLTAGLRGPTASIDAVSASAAIRLERGVMTQGAEGAGREACTMRVAAKVTGR
ncbi:hypothetical protein [Burkholderia sp. Ax-1719]|uniref:hypothetical protein n=1 Tax=Burkholderia sp. Ax-1719 TaxID=2608334 RepID=UPI00142189D3|nr:hypothetical protein [Burkholderia sp. Ax-1719]NIE67665.1 hypothetical protein [Burkholderia sp. Ax-1719]